MTTRGVNPPKSPEAQANFKAYQKQWALENRERLNAEKKIWAREYRAKLRLEMIAAYGGECSCCGETNPGFLTTEHIGGRTGVEKKTATHEILRLRKLGWPDTVTCLCYNCNIGSAHNGGVCPHKEIPDGPADRE